MGLSRRRFLSSATVLGAAVAAGCTTTVEGSAQANPADLRRASESAGPPMPDEVEVVVISYEPYTIEDGDNLSGPVPDVARKVLTGLGVANVKFTVVRDQQVVVTMAAAGRLEVAGGLVVRPDLCDQLAYSIPDYVSGTAFAVAAGNPKGLATYADVVAKGAKLVVWTGLPEEQDAVAAGVPDGSIVRLQPDPARSFATVRDGQADCFAFDELSLRGLVKQFGDGLEVAEPFMPEGRLPLIGAYTFPQASPLLAPFNEALQELHDSGEWLRMVEPFGLSERNAPPAELTTEKACAG
jgi:polar amino acid transport system substrate-binding protein